jgi:armadillo repeat-containing protein 8
VRVALQALLNIEEAISLTASSPSITVQDLADHVFVSQHIESLNSILATSSSNPIIQSQIALVARLISRLCRDEPHQFALANSGVLDSLASRLAGFAVAEGFVIPHAESVSRNDGLADFIPDPAPRGSNLAVILEAIAAVVADSRFRACMLLCSPAILAVFPSLPFFPLKEARAPWDSLDINGLGYPNRYTLGAMDYLLPVVPSHSRSSAISMHFSSLSSLGSRGDIRSNGRSSGVKIGGAGGAVWETARFEPHIPTGESDPEDSESPLIPWLVHLTRSQGPEERLFAASVLTWLFKAGFGSKSVREASLGLLVVPVLLDLLKDCEVPADSPAPPANTSLLFQTILEKTPAVLARLITDSDYLQKSAFESGAVKILSRILREAYDPVPTSSNIRTWSPQPNTGLDTDAALPGTRLGPDGQSPLLAHRIKVRESVLKAIGALAAGNDEYRKVFVEQDIVPYVVESLNEYPDKPRGARERLKADKADKAVDEPINTEAKDGYGINPLSVIIAACHTVRMLSRSVSVLRTYLVDFGVSKPLFGFLRHPDIDVQIAATAVMCNLVIEVSPMREVRCILSNSAQPSSSLSIVILEAKTNHFMLPHSQRLTEDGVLNVLCEHAHSLNPALRFNALWALKHFVQAVGPDLKKKCLEELEPGWLVQLIRDDSEDDALFSRYGNLDKQTSSSLIDDMDEDIDMETIESQTKSWFSSTSVQLETEGKQQPERIRQTEAKLAALRDSEINNGRKARNDDLAIQEQGLDFIRNLIGGAGSSASQDSSSETTEMIDFLFSALDKDRLFKILTSKLRTRVLHPFSRRSGASGRETRVLYPQAKIIAIVIFILVHMAASMPKHRQLVIAQTDLLKLAGTHFNSKDKEVRVALCHLIGNLTWQDDASDAHACAQRTHELKKLGFVSKLEELEQKDSELDVRERAKTALWQMKQGSF